MILPVLMCENRSRTTCSRFDRLHSESNLTCGCGLWGSTRSSRAAHSPLPTRCQITPTLACGCGLSHTLSKEKNAHADTTPAESPLSLQQSSPGSVVPENARPPVLSPDACKRQAPRFPPGSLTLAHPRSASQQDSARAPVAHAAHRPRSAAQGLEDQVHQAHLITASKDNVPTPIRVNKTYNERYTENRHMSMRIVARFS